MRSKRYTVEQIVAKLREAEKLQAQGLTIPQACKRLGISDQTFYRWRIKYGALKEDEAQRLKALEQENARLKRIVAEQALDISLLRDLQRGNCYDDHRVTRARSCVDTSAGAAWRREDGSFVSLEELGLGEMAGWLMGSEDSWRARFSEERFHDPRADLRLELPPEQGPPVDE
jgi:transposase-like protein